MGKIILLFAVAAVLKCSAETSAPQEWLNLKAKRDHLASFHQEFDVTGTTTSSRGARSSKTQVILDGSGARWRAVSISGSGKHTRIFDGDQTLQMEEGGDEYLRAKRKSKDQDPLPEPYEIDHPDWSKTVEVEHRACGISKTNDPQCVLLKVPLRPFQRASSPNNIAKVTGGVDLILLETATGLIVSSRIVESIETTRLSYRSDVSYQLERMAFGAPAKEALFQLPSPDMREVKELSRWNAARIRKQLVGQPAPELDVTDLAGKHLSLTDFKGKTVLLDFWTTWCGPCRKDAPSLDKLYSKYGGTNLMIVSISVSEDRAVVEKYLSEHPRAFPVVLTSENEIPRPYQIGAFPTYIVIGRDGEVMAAEEGDQGFGELRKLLKKAGVEAE